MESTITQKGQVTIPAEIRRALGIETGTESYRFRRTLQRHKGKG